MFKPVITFCILLNGWIGKAHFIPQIHSSNKQQTGISENVPLSISADTLPPVERKPPNTTYKAAFAGQTRISGMATQTAYQSSILTDKLRSPWAIAMLPDGRFLVNQKFGDMRIVNIKGEITAPITGLPAVNPSDQGGLLGLALDPGFGNNRILYWAYSENQGEENVTAVAKGKLSPDEKRIENISVIYRATPLYKGTIHYGGRLLFDKSGNLFLSTGERAHLQTRQQAQQLNSGFGKVIRITRDGKPAPGNPFTGSHNAGTREEIYSYGHRNVQGIALHPVTGDLWEHEFGPKGGDELNLIKPGSNYGWPVITYGTEYSGRKIGDSIQQKEGMEQPVYYWDPVVSPSGMTFYTGTNMPEWKNNLFISCLGGQQIVRLKIENNRVTGEERLLEKEGQRFRDIIQGKDGALYTITDQGRLYRIGK
ncbi:MAG: PQQ-dependent sugar dehydrogenase [Chitinophagaceae bacterium]|nr:MAG: PQQ-dependent sugar dehydrogenase [Chitinophagaceae bacterium]